MRSGGLPEKNDRLVPPLVFMGPLLDWLESEWKKRALTGGRNPRSSTCACTYTPMRTCAHARTRAHAHTCANARAHTHMQVPSIGGDSMPILWLVSNFCDSCMPAFCGGHELRQHARPCGYARAPCICRATAHGRLEDQVV